MLDEQYRLIIKKNICNLEGKPSEIDDYLKSLVYSQNPGEATEYAWEIINKMYERENLLSLSDYGLVPPGSPDNDFPPEDEFNPEESPSYDKDDDDNDGDTDGEDNDGDDEDDDSDDDESDGDDEDTDDTDGDEEPDDEGDDDDEDESDDSDDDETDGDDEDSDSDEEEDDDEGDGDDEEEDNSDDNSQEPTDDESDDGDNEVEPDDDDTEREETPDDEVEEPVVPVVKSSRVKKELKGDKTSVSIIDKDVLDKVKPNKVVPKEEKKVEPVKEVKVATETVPKVPVRQAVIQTSDKEFVIRIPDDMRNAVNQGPIYLLPADTGKEAEFRVIQLRVATDENLNEARKIHAEIMEALEAEKNIRDNIFAQLQAFKGLSEQLSENVEQASEIRQMLLDGTTRAERFLNNDMLRLLQQRAQEATNEFYQESRDHYNELFRAAVKRYKQFTQAAMEFQDKMADDNDKTLRNIQSRVNMIQNVTYFLCVVVLIVLALTIVFKVF